MNDLNIKIGAQTVLPRSYLASLPERTARAGAPLAGGMVYEASERPKHRTRKVPPPAAEAKDSSAHLILNPAAGNTAALLRRLLRAARERGIRVRVLKPGEDARLAALAAVEDGAKSLAVAGGDGSVAAVAAVAVERDLPLVVVPTGTLNHFARDLGLDLVRPLRALDALDAGQERSVDVGRINGRPFINNVSLGVYAEMLGDPAYRRDKLRVAQSKLQAAFFDPGGRRALRITPPEEAPLEGAVAVVVSNNPYEFARWDRLGQRQHLDTGTLQVSVLDASTLDELERLLAGTLLGTIKFRPALRHWTSAFWRERAGWDRRRADHLRGAVALLCGSQQAARARTGRAAREPENSAAGGRLARRSNLAPLAKPDPRSL